MKAFPFSAGTVEKIGNVLKITYEKDAEITEDDMREITPIREQLFGSQKFVSLIDLRADKIEMSNDALKFVTDNKIIRQHRIAEVLLVKSFTQWLGIHAYVKIFRSKDNITVMTDEENAIHWLNRQFEKHHHNLVESK